MYAFQNLFNSLMEHGTNALMLTMQVEFSQKLYKLKPSKVPINVRTSAEGLDVWEYFKCILTLFVIVLY